jgi:hypothetical protein
VTRLFEGEVEVSYSQAYVLAENAEQPGLEEAFTRQLNGLCGAPALP